MLIDQTSDKIQFKLGSSVTTNQLIFTVDYVNYTSTSATLTSNNGSSNNITAVDLIPSPSISQQNELRYCSIYNSDTIDQTVKILVYNGTTTYQIFQALLSPNDMMQYQLEKGWEVVNSVGNKKNYSVFNFNNTIRNSTRNWRVSANATQQLTANIMGYNTLGRADKSYTNIFIRYEITSPGLGITAAELGIFSCRPSQTESATWIGKKVGYLDTSTIWNSASIKSATVPVSGIMAGDILKIGFYLQGTGQPNIRSLNVNPETLNDWTFGYYNGGGVASKISTNPSLYATNSGVHCYMVDWQGT